MSRIYVDTVLPETSGIAENLNLGASGDNVIVPAGATLKTNKIADSGGNNIVTSDGSGNLTVNAGMMGNISLLSTDTVSNVASDERLLTGSYKLYIIRFINIQPATDQVKFQMQARTAATAFGTGIVKSSGYWYNYNSQAGSGSLGNAPSYAIQNSTTALTMGGYTIGNADGENLSGDFYFWPGSGRASNFLGQFNWKHHNQESVYSQIYGYYDVSAAITGFKWYMNSGNFQGTVKIYGVG